MSYKITPITLRAKIESMSGSILYGESDGSGLQSDYIRYDVTVKDVLNQNHADESSREPLLYNGLDIRAGMFIASEDANTVLKIVSISDKTTNAVTCVVEDVDMLSFRINGSNTVANNGNIVIFDLNPEGEPVIIGSPFLSGAADKVQSRFNLNEKDDRVKFSHESAPSLDLGDVVSINTSGELVKYGTTGSTETKVGIVLDKLRNGKDIFVKPFNDIIRDYSNPETLDGTPSSTYYTDINEDGKITTTQGGVATFIQLNEAIPTTQSITSTTQPGTTDTLIINGVTVFDGPGGDTVGNSSELSDQINTFTSETNVTSAITQSPGVVDAESNTVAYPGSWGDNDIFIPLNALGEPLPSTYPEITISDGINTENVVFDTSDATAIGYNVISPAGIASAIQTVITASGLNLSVETYRSTEHNGDAIRITTNGSATGVTLTNVKTDPFGGNVVGNASSTGISLTANLGDPTLVLTRSSGGPIEIDGTPLSGGYINQGGVVSSNSGRVPYLMLIESEGASGVSGVSGTSGTSGTSGESGTVTGVELTNSVLEITNSDSSTISVDFDPSNDTQNKNGVTTHGFIFLDETSFSAQPFNDVFEMSSINTATMFYQFNLSDFSAKTTYVVLDVVDTGSTLNYITILPEFTDSNDDGRVIKFITKRNNLEVKNDLIVSSKWVSGGTTNRIMSTNLKTKLEDSGFFYPLETLESTDLLYDGSDWLAVNVQKQSYFNYQPVNYLVDGDNGTVGQYKNRDLDNLL